MRERGSPSPSASASGWVAEALRMILENSASQHTNPLPSPEDWSLIGPSIARHRVSGLLAPFLVRSEVPEDLIARVRAQHLRSVSDGLRVAHDTVRASTALRHAGIEHLIVKGIALAGLVGEDIASRGSGDIDIWVRPSEVSAAEEALRTQGWGRRYDAQRFPRFEDSRRWRWFLREMNEIPLSHSTCADVDLHWRLGHSDAELSFDFEDARRNHSTVQVGVAQIHTLCPEYALEHLAQHARKEAWPNLRSVVDIIQVCRTLEGDLIRDIAKKNRNVRIAVNLASRLDESLAPLAHLSQLEKDLADEAWRRCFSGLSWFLVQPRSSGWYGVRRWFDHNSWLWRSSPSWRVRWRFLSRGILRARMFLDPRRRPWEKGAAITAARSD